MNNEYNQCFLNKDRQFKHWAPINFYIFKSPALVDTEITITHLRQEKKNQKQNGKKNCRNLHPCRIIISNFIY